jgi:hypothetical protein
VGVRTGSIANRDRKSKDVVCVISGDTMLWRIVGMINEGGQVSEGRILKLCTKLLFGVDTDVTISLQLS